MKHPANFLLCAGGIDRSGEHAGASATLATAMDPRFVSLLTLTVISGAPTARQQDRDAMLEAIDAALAGRVPLRPDWARVL